MLTDRCHIERGNGRYGSKKDRSRDEYPVPSIEIHIIHSVANLYLLQDSDEKSLEYLKTRIVWIKEGYFLISFFNRYIVSAVNTGILCADSVCSINCTMTSRSVAPVTS